MAPDRDRDQLESELTFRRGEGHAGNGMYCWLTEYPEEGALFVDGSTTVPTEAAPAPADERAAFPRYAEWLHLRAHGAWSNDVPEWARNHTGRMNDFTAASAAIEELAATCAASAIESRAEGADSLAHEVWSAAQLTPGEGIDDGVHRIAAILSRSPAMYTDDTCRMRTLCRLLDAIDEEGNGLPIEVHEAFQHSGKQTRAALDAVAAPEDYAGSPAIAAKAVAHTLLRDIINSLPSRRDWLDPATKRVARALLAARPPMVPVPKDMIEAREQGRAEVLALLLAVSPDTFCCDCIADGGSLPSGERNEGWDEDALKELLRTDDRAYSLVLATEDEYWHNIGLREDAERVLAEARTLRASAQSDARERLDELRATVCAIGVVGSIDGHDVIRRASVVELIDLRRARLQGANHAE